MPYKFGVGGGVIKPKYTIFDRKGGGMTDYDV